MDGVIIHIGWEYFLGIVFALLAVAWYSNGRFTALETSMQWVKDTLNELKVTSDNASKPVFITQSPVNLNPIGESWLIESGLKEYIDKNRDYFLGQCEEEKDKNPYEVQKHAFKIFDGMSFDSELDDKLKKFAYEKGTSMAIVRRVGGIYLRNLCLEKFGMNKDDIDKHAPPDAPKI